MLGGLGEPWIRTCGYLLVAVAMAWQGWRELRRPAGDDRGWPAFWFVCAGVLAAMALGRAGDLGDAVSEIGRQDARAEGWYESRRELQVLVVVGLAGAWLVAAVAVLWRCVATGRQGYVPLLLVVLGLVCFVGMRLVSLHQVDALLHNRSEAGLQLGAAAELAGIGLALGLTLLTPRYGDRPRYRAEVTGLASGPDRSWR